MVIELEISTDHIQNDTTADAADVILPLIQLKEILENIINGVQPAEAIRIGSEALHASAAFQISSTTKVALFPRMTTAQRDAITGVLESGFIYNTDTDEFQFYDGADWQVLATGDAQSGAACRVYKSAPQTIADSTETTVSWNSESYDTDTMHDVAIDNSRITIKTAGKYLFTSCVKFATTINVGAFLGLRLNGTTMIAGQTMAAPASISQYITVVGVIELDVNDYVEVRAYHASGGDEDIDNAVSYFAASRQLD